MITITKAPQVVYIVAHKADAATILRELDALDHVGQLLIGGALAEVRAKLTEAQKRK